MTVASGAESNRDHTEASEVARATRGGVTITVTGALAADMIGRGESEKRERQALAAELRQRLDAVEAALAQRAAEQAQLEQHAQDLRAQLAQLGGQTEGEVDRLRAELGRMRTGFVEAGDRFRDLHDRLDRLEARLGSLHGTIGGLEGTVGDLKEAVGRLTSPPDRPLLLVWRKGLHFWAAVAAMTLTATVGALWLYA